ncbi:MAG: hypothetical protein Q8S13_04965 [Dehalococcoidia bacterium]|nr:hypothetical protein [Dehalococcoidia bacterium]
MTAPLQVLVVEDLEDRWRALAVFVTRARTGVRRAATAASAIAELECGAYDVICLDYDLDQDGALDAAVTGHGGRVASWMARPENNQRWRLHRGSLPLVIIHSKNGPGATSMLITLMSAGYEVAWIPAPLGANCDQQFRLIGSIIAARAAVGDAPHAT